MEAERSFLPHDLAVSGELEKLYQEVLEGRVKYQYSNWYQPNRGQQEDITLGRGAGVNRRRCA